MVSLRSVSLCRHIQWSFNDQCTPWSISILGSPGATSQSTEKQRVFHEHLFILVSLRSILAMNLSFVCFFNKCNCHKKYISKGNRTYPKTFGNISQGLSVFHSPDDNHLLAFSIQSITIKHNLNAHIWFSAHSQHDIKSTSQECKDSQHPNDFIYLLSAFDYIHLVKQIV